jgi:integrase
MPIIDYEKLSGQNWDNVLNSKLITDVNKDYLISFDKQYKRNVKPSRRGIFYRHIIHLLKFSKDIKQEMQDRDIINNIFEQIQAQNIAPSYMATIINVSLVLVRWLNDGEKPKGFKDIKNVSKKAQRRDLNPDDMITWEEAELMCKQTNSIQLKAILMTQLDIGLRPSEFIDLKYKDVTFNKHIVTITAPCTKVEEKDYPAPWGVRCTPYLQKWIRSHPTKNPNDPLWITENLSKSSVHRHNKNSKNIVYSYPAILKMVNLLSKKAKLNRKIDFYLLRHSSCTLDKLDNIPIDLASDRHRHSINYFKSTYGRLSNKDILNRVNKFFGYDVKKEKLEKNIICVTCNCINKPNTDFCSDCSTPLTPEASAKYAIQQKQEKQKEFEAMKVSILETIFKDKRFK